MPDLTHLPPDVRGLIFDCDGTLVRTPPVYAHAWATGFRSSGLEMPPEWYLDRAGLSEHVLMDAFEADWHVTLDREDVVRRMRADFLERLSELREITPIANVARRHHGRLPMAVASGGPAAIVLPTLRTTALLPLFDTVVTIEDVSTPKPAPDLFVEAARRLGLPPERCLVFEDSRQGLEAARRAGTHVLDVTAVL